MFSNTRVECHVETSEDGRFVFAGLLRGSSEMLALDITDLPRWGTLPTREVGRGRGGMVSGSGDRPLLRRRNVRMENAWVAATH